ncbi:MAG: MipA/OmpV family protein [Alteromonadaceae bacterium]|nr:MipA/OmpV family protein [Alteromonadaceae bacterium]
MSFSTELGVTYPISENWVFKATARAATISDEITDSPYYQNKDSLATSFRTSLSYVF